MSLKFDSQGAYNEFIKLLEQELDGLFDIWKSDVLSKMLNSYYQKNAKASVEMHYDETKKSIITIFKANANVLADSFGTGSLMLDDNPIVKEYLSGPKGNKEGQINPARKGKTIVGRPAGTYKDIFGNVRTTKGTYKGINIENLNIKKEHRQKPFIYPTSPSNVIRDADKYLYSHLQDAYQRAVRRLNFSKFLIEY